MAIFIFMFISLAGGVLLELISGNWGVIVPSALPVVFYFSIACGWQTGLICALASGIALDTIYGREFPASTVLLCIASGLSIFWILREDSKKLVMNVIPALVTGFIYMLPLCMMVLYFHGFEWRSFFLAFFRLSFGVFLSLIFLPLSIAVLDTYGGALGFPTYRDARDRILKASPTGWK